MVQGPEAVRVMRAIKTALDPRGLLNPGILTKTQCGEYYHVAHSHDLTQATNYGASFGGMLTLIRVDPADDSACG